MENIPKCQVLPKEQWRSLRTIELTLPIGKWFYSSKIFYYRDFGTEYEDWLDMAIVNAIKQTYPTMIVEFKGRDIMLDVEASSFKKQLENYSKIPSEVNIVPDVSKIDDLQSLIGKYLPFFTIPICIYVNKGLDEFDMKFFNTMGFWLRYEYSEAKVNEIIANKEKLLPTMFNC